MDLQEELRSMQSLLFDRISSAASDRDLVGAAALSGLANECKALEAELASLNRRVEAAKRALSDSSSVSSGRFTQSAELPTPSRKVVGAQARNEWVVELGTHGISLVGHGKRYQSARGQSVAVAFANELRGHENRWFLGLPDEHTDVAVLLCKSLEGKLCDVVLPVSRLHEAWRVLSRHKGEVKFNVKKDASRFLLHVPANDPVDVTTYVGNYEPLR